MRLVASFHVIVSIWQAYDSGSYDLDIFCKLFGTLLIWLRLYIKCQIQRNTVRASPNS